MRNQDDIRRVLEENRTIAVVGLSRSPLKDSHSVSKYMQSFGYRIVPINPFAKEILGEKCYNSLIEMQDSLKQEIDIVNVFRPSRDVPRIASEVLALKSAFNRPKVFWTQLGIVDETSAEQVRRAGIKVIMDRCLKIEHQALGIRPSY